ncbi:MAG: hypothetical protein GX601_07950 [Anaerolineales bacterium]|nr:hypothetical protein [Anaerolineales bacterium]
MPDHGGEVVARLWAGFGVAEMLVRRPDGSLWLVRPDKEEAYPITPEGWQRRTTCAQG